MMSDRQFTPADFKKLCFHIESVSQRKLVVDEVHINTYPNSFWYCTFNHETLLFACNIHEPVFALVDMKENSSTDLLRKGFIEVPGFKQIVNDHLNLLQIRFNFPPAEFFNLKFYDKKDYEAKIAALNTDNKNIDLALGRLMLEYDQYCLYPGTVGTELFNYLDD